jgi:PqqD family protein of HPr-rel-A system
MMSDDMIVARREALLATEVDGEMVALHVEKGTCYGFNGTATRIWAMLEEPRRLSEIRDSLLEEFDVDPETCEREVRQLLQELEADGLIELRPAGGGA